MHLPPTEREWIKSHFLSTRGQIQMRVQYPPINVNAQLADSLHSHPGFGVHPDVYLGLSRRLDRTSHGVGTDLFSRG